jgi:hypothetical protein
MVIIKKIIKKQKKTTIFIKFKCNLFLFIFIFLKKKKNFLKKKKRISKKKNIFTEINKSKQNK